MAQCVGRRAIGQGRECVGAVFMCALVWLRLLWDATGI